MQETPVLTLTDPAREAIREARADEIDAATLALWLEVSAVAAFKFSYDMYFQSLTEASDGDVVLHHDDLAVVVPAASVSRIQGSTLDIAADGSGMVIVNPNEPKLPDLDALAASLDEPLARRVAEVIEHQINPQVAAHGGFAQLVAVDGGTVFLRMGGGCQGCSSAKATLTQGIEVAIREAVPEVVEIVDVTDHASGSDPYYQSAH